MSFKWKDNYSVNIAEIDEQHKKLFEIGDRVYGIVLLDDEYDHYDEIVEIIEELRDYTIYHFDYEERMLERYGYDELEFQHFQHSFFVKRLEKIVSKDIDEDQKETIRDIVEFLADWITNHILQSDMKYSQFLNNEGIF